MKNKNQTGLKNFKPKINLFTTTYISSFNDLTVLLSSFSSNCDFTVLFIDNLSALNLKATDMMSFCSCYSNMLLALLHEFVQKSVHIVL